MESRINRCIAAFSIPVLVSLVSCSKPLVTTTSRVTPKPTVRSVEGTWVCQFSGGGTTKGSTMSFLSTGTVTIHDPKKKDESFVFLSEPFAEYIARKEKETGKAISKDFEKGDSWSLFLRACNVISFYKGTVKDRGEKTGHIFYEPYNQILMDPYNEEWRRVGDIHKESDSSIKIPAPN